MSTTPRTESDPASVKNLVSVDKNGCIKVLDPEVLDLIAGGVSSWPVTRHNANCWLILE